MTFLDPVRGEIKVLVKCFVVVRHLDQTSRTPSNPTSKIVYTVKSNQMLESGKSSIIRIGKRSIRPANISFKNGIDARVLRRLNARSLRRRRVGARKYRKNRNKKYNLISCATFNIHYHGN